MVIFSYALPKVKSKKKLMIANHPLGRMFTNHPFGRALASQAEMNELVSMVSMEESDPQLEGGIKPIFNAVRLTFKLTRL